MEVKVTTYNNPPKSIAAGQDISLRQRRPLDGPVVADLAAATTPEVAQLDARWAAAVLAGGARDAHQLADWLQMTGLLPAGPWWGAS